MAVIVLGVDWNQSSGGEIDAQGVRTYTLIYNVQTQFPAELGPLVFNAPGIPLLFSAYPYDPFAYLIKKSVSNHGNSWNHKTVSCEYSSKLPFDPTQQDENPLNRPPVFRVSTNKFTRIATTDALGKPYLNSAGDPFEGGTELLDSRAVYSITWNADIFSIPDPLFMTMQNKVNSTWYRGFEPGRLLVCDLNSEFAFENNVPHYKRSCQLEDKPNKWNPVRRLDQGYRGRGMPIRTATNAAPIAIETEAPHNLQTGEFVTISGARGNVAANVDGILQPPWVITVTGPKTFTLVDSTGDGEYAGGGYVERLIENPQQFLERGQPVSSPVLLDGLGHRLRHGEIEVYLEHDDYETAPFFALP